MVLFREPALPDEAGFFGEGKKMKEALTEKMNLMHPL